LPTTAEQLAEVQRCFGLTKTQLALVCDVQRQTIYDWYARHFEAEADNARRLGALYKLARFLRTAGLQPLAPKLVERKLDQGQALLDLLRAPVPDQRAIRNVATHLNTLAVARRERSAAAVRERYGWKPLTQDQRDENLDSNLDSLSDG
jgi:DNA-binding XRE family transcriptional regulator